MAKLHLSPKGALVMFIILTVTILAQAVWWIIFMAGLVNEKVEMAEQLGADQAFVEEIHAQEIKRQVMVGMEGLFFLVLIGGGAWLIYRAQVKSEQLKFHQQNFLMAVTHELKTPLASIKVYLDTLSSTKIPEEKKARVLPRMQTDLVRLQKLVENILEAGRFERSGYKLHPERLSLSDLVDHLVEKYRSLPWERPIEITANVAPDLHVMGDVGALGRSIEAVLENALKYSDKNTIALLVSLEKVGARVRLIIADNGVGLSKAEHDRVFDRFYRVGSELSRERPGSGLGLYLCREVIRAHGGNITVDSDGPGQGAKFTITLEAIPNNENDTAG